MLKLERLQHTQTPALSKYNDNRRHPALATEICNGIYRYYLCMGCFSIHRKFRMPSVCQVVGGGGPTIVDTTAFISQNENYLLVKTAVTFNKFMPKGNVSEMSELNFERERETSSNKYSTFTHTSGPSTQFMETRSGFHFMRRNI